MNGVFYCTEESILILENISFENIKTGGPGTFLLVLNNVKGLVKITNCTFTKSVSKSTFIDYELSSTLIFENNFFSNNEGNVIFTINSGMNLTNSSFENNICFYDSGCIFNIQKFSILNLFQISIVNISNFNEGGSFYVSDSVLSIQDQMLINSNSSNFGGCLFGKNIEVFFRNIFVENYSHGCMYFVNSSISIENSIFSNKFQEIAVSSLCYSTICSLQSWFLMIGNCSFSGNKNNTYYGGVAL